jgi:hypothetical protein
MSTVLTLAIDHHFAPRPGPRRTRATEIAAHEHQTGERAGRRLEEIASRVHG